MKLGSKQDFTTTDIANQIFLLLYFQNLDTMSTERKVGSDIDIAQAAKMEHINEIAGKLNISVDDLEHYGKYKAKLPLNLIDDAKAKQNKLILVTALTPTPAGEGKTTVSIGLTEGLNNIGKQATVVLREPSLGLFWN